MAWKIEYTRTAVRELKSLDRQTVARIHKYLTETVVASEKPRAFGKSLSNNLSMYWRYRVGDYRLICDIQDEVLTVLVVKVGHRRLVYEKS